MLASSKHTREAFARLLVTRKTQSRRWGEVQYFNASASSPQVTSSAEPARMSKRNLLLCFDAFGTLFTPKRPITQQYAEVARQCGLGGFTDEQLRQSFRQAFKAEAKRHPNYGKASGLGAAAWWTKVGFSRSGRIVMAN